MNRVLRASLSACARPPCSSMIVRTIASPSPADPVESSPTHCATDRPDRSDRRSVRARKDRSARLRSRRIRGPRSSALWIDSVIMPCAGVNRIALASRLLTARLNSSTSARRHRGPAHDDANAGIVRESFEVVGDMLQFLAAVDDRACSSTNCGCSARARNSTFSIIRESRSHSSRFDSSVA